MGCFARGEGGEKFVPGLSLERSFGGLRRLYDDVSPMTGLVSVPAGSLVGCRRNIFLLLGGFDLMSSVCLAGSIHHNFIVGGCVVGNTLYKRLGECLTTGTPRCQCGYLVGVTRTIG